MIYLGIDQILEIDPGLFEEPIIVDVNRYIKTVVMYKSKDGKQIITNLVPGEPNAS